MASIRKVGVIGAGQMGSGIAHVSALGGLEVRLNDVNADRIKAGIATINGNMARQAKRNLITEEQRQAALKKIAPAETLDGLSDCDLVIEAATEKEDVKRKIFATLCPVLKPTTIIGTNTSSISITGSPPDRPAGKFIGIHFMNPVPLMELVSCPWHRAEDGTFETIKEPYQARQGRGAGDFPPIVNCILLPMINEAIYTL
jgi:3-hydroxybutyryl-CoA dehydrogenase